MTITAFPSLFHTKPYTLPRFHAPFLAKPHPCLFILLMSWLMSKLRQK